MQIKNEHLTACVASYFSADFCWQEFPREKSSMVKIQQPPTLFFFFFFVSDNNSKEESSLSECSTSEKLESWFFSTSDPENKSLL